jgi:hypothetical protein
VNIFSYRLVKWYTSQRRSIGTSRRHDHHQRLSAENVEHQKPPATPLNKFHMTNLGSQSCLVRSFVKNCVTTASTYDATALTGTISPLQYLNPLTLLAQSTSHPPSESPQPIVGHFREDSETDTTTTNHQSRTGNRGYFDFSASHPKQVTIHVLAKVPSPYMAVYGCNEGDVRSSVQCGSEARNGEPERQ